MTQRDRDLAAFEAEYRRHFRTPASLKEFPEWLSKLAWSPWVDGPDKLQYLTWFLAGADHARREMETKRGIGTDAIKEASREKE